MVTNEQKKEFALSQLAPYFADPKTCGYDAEKKFCQYITSDGRMCVLGKNMLHPKTFMDGEGAFSILSGNLQKDVLKPEAVDILTPREWEKMQHIHDALADNGSLNEIKTLIEMLNLFTYEELVERANSLKKV